MSQMVELLNSFPLSDGGVTESQFNGVRFFKSTYPTPRKPMVYDPSICIVAQGHKSVIWAEKNFNMTPIITW